MEERPQETSLSVLKIPEERIAVLIGRGGKTKRLIEKTGEVNLVIESSSGSVEVISRGDPLKKVITNSVVMAIGRGFSPERAILLYSDSYQLAVISLRDFANPGSRRISQIRARLIGSNGRTRQILEELTGTAISVYGDTVSIIGDYVSMEYAREAITMLINGSKQRTVYTYLERNARKMRYQKIEETFG
ncbi:MAG: KH domain-containing protein [Candidatus Thermoplasmatota archaeon]|nr:KH domain-containing protein [Candidatus Thermoplasmatota archaeon]